MPRMKYKYDFKKGNRIIHSGITSNLKRREVEHKEKYSGGRIVKVVHKTPEEAVRKWEKIKKKS